MEQYFPVRHPWVDSSLAPLYQVTFPARASDDKLLSYCRAVANWSTQVTYSVGWLMDLSPVKEVSAQQRAIFASYMRSMEAFDRRCTKGSALILPNALMRGVATAIFWLHKPSFQHRTFAEPGEGLAWLREIMREGCIEPVPTPDEPSSARPAEHISVHPRATLSPRTAGSDSAAPGAPSSVPPTNIGGDLSQRPRDSARPNQR